MTYVQLALIAGAIVMAVTIWERWSIYRDRKESERRLKEQKEWNTPPDAIWHDHKKEWK